jgi:hypothetical protein
MGFEGSVCVPIARSFPCDFVGGSRGQRERLVGFENFVDLHDSIKYYKPFTLRAGRTSFWRSFSSLKCLHITDANLSTANSSLRRSTPGPLLGRPPVSSMSPKGRYKRGYCYTLVASPTFLSGSMDVTVTSLLGRSFRTRWSVC